MYRDHAMIALLVSCAPARVRHSRRRNDAACGPRHLGQITNVASGTRNVAFTWSPAGEWLASGYGDPDVPGFYRAVRVVHPDGSSPRTLSQDPTAAFYWSPDSTQWAAVGFDSGARALTWTAVGVVGKRTVYAARSRHQSEQILVVGPDGAKTGHANRRWRRRRVLAARQRRGLVSVPTLR